ncbi:MAG: hypothetical protein SFV32_10865 [Opitutaceae bacterium]|nr:hypothetical protein [Opitutaceae bacterium]
MAPFKVLDDGDILRIVVSGPISTHHILNFIRHSYPKHPRENVLWDLSDAQPDSPAVDELKRLAESNLAVFRELRPVGRTAFVASNPSVFALVCVFSTICMVQDSPIEHAIFSTRVEAEAWLKVIAPPVAKR